MSGCDHSRNASWATILFALATLMSVPEPSAAQTPMFEGELPFEQAEAPGSLAIGTESPLSAPQPDEGDSIWKNTPPARPAPRTGNFPILPKGPGEYSLADVLSGKHRPGPPKFPYAPFGLMPASFFDADFRYLDDPKNAQRDWLDSLKRIRGDGDWMFTTGGQALWRHMRETDSRLTSGNNVYELYRIRAFGDLWYRDLFRIYAEYIYADNVNADLPPLPIDGTRNDLLNLFIDAKIAEVADKPVYARVGRQELLLGSQRLVSTLDWANTRRTFQGARLLRQGEAWDFDLFWAQPVIPDLRKFDSVDNNQNFAGAWATHRPKPGTTRDFYYLFLDNTNRVNRQDIVSAPFDLHTIGTRWAGDENDWLYDVEAALQLGNRGDQGIVAGMATGGLGYHFADWPMNPTLWAYYDWASGDANPGAGGRYGTFNQLFPFGHYYLGWLDLVGRQNIQDANVHLYLYPTKWITVWTQYHHFQLSSSSDALYNAGGVAIRRDPTGRSGFNVGDEVDLVVNFHLDAHSDVLTGYSKLFSGGFINGSGPAVSPELFYVQYSFRW